MKSVLRWTVLALLGATMWAQTAQSPHTKAKAHARARTTAANSELKALRQALDAQQQQIQQLREALQQRDSALQQVQQQVTTLQASATDAQTAAKAAASTGQQNTEAVTALQTTVADLRTNATSAATSFQEEQKRIGELEQPAKLHFRGVDITPGGFIEAAGIVRSRNENADLPSSWGSLPFGGTANAGLSEFRASARQSRLSLLAETKVGGIKASGYWEMDFLGGAPTANEVETNSFNVRQRQLWGQAEFGDGMSFLGGQAWSLLTTNKKGLAPRGEWVPATIDAQYAVGYNFARQLGARFTKNFNNKVWWAVSVENPETSLSVLNPPKNVFGFNTSPNATSPNSGFTLNNVPGANGVSTDLAPDIITKVAIEPGWGHYELKAIGRFFRDRVNTSNNVTEGGGIGFGAIMPMTKKVDLILEGLAGSGIGRYAAANGPDVTLRPDGSIVPLRTAHALAGIEAHPTPKWDWYMYGGAEYWGRASYVDPATGKLVGYGLITADLSGCGVQAPSSTQLCQSVNKDVWQVQPGFWYRIFKGREGVLQTGMSYSYTYRTVWPGVGGNPKGIENVIMTSFRYYLP